MNTIECVLLSGRVYDKKDNSGKGLSINVLVNANDLASAQIVNLYAGKSYVGEYDLSKYNLLERISVDYEQVIGSQYPKLINIHKIVKK